MRNEIKKKSRKSVRTETQKWAEMIPAVCKVLEDATMQVLAEHEIKEWIQADTEMEIKNSVDDMANPASFRGQRNLLIDLREMLG